MEDEQDVAPALVTRTFITVEHERERRSTTTVRGRAAPSAGHVAAADVARPMPARPYAPIPPPRLTGGADHRTPLVGDRLQARQDQRSSRSRSRRATARTRRAVWPLRARSYASRRLIASAALEIAERPIGCPGPKAMRNPRASAPRRPGLAAIGLDVGRGKIVPPSQWPEPANHGSSRHQFGAAAARALTSTSRLSIRLSRLC